MREKLGGPQQEIQWLKVLNLEIMVNQFVFIHKQPCT